MYKNDLIRRQSLISKFMTSHTEQQVIAIHILSNILRSKGNLTMKVDQLIIYKIRNIFLEKSNIKCGGDANPRTVKSKLSTSLDQQSESLFLMYVQFEVYQYILELRY